MGPRRERELTLIFDKVFGVGWAKTGTTTLGSCFTSLGFCHCSQRLELFEHLFVHNMTPVLEVAEKFDSFDDWPWILLYTPLDCAFPNSAFVLTNRHEDAWLRSYRNMLRNEPTPTAALLKIRRFIYGDNPSEMTDCSLLELYRKHNASVRAHFSGTDRLLELNFEDGDGWPQLCGFLGCPAPNMELPHLNRGVYQNPGI